MRSPRNILARIGTSFKECVEFCGGYAEGGPGKIISGGPMMGIAMYTDEVPVIAGTSGILALPEGEARLPEPGACLHCGRCHRVCPMRLQPYAIEDALTAHDAGRAARFGAQHCIEMRRLRLHLPRAAAFGAEYTPGQGIGARQRRRPEASALKIRKRLFNAAERTARA